jgi:hypothetical protein
VNDEITEACLAVWPDDTEFVILRSVDWLAVKGRLPNDTYFDDMLLLPLTLEKEKEF